MRSSVLTLLTAVTGGALQAGIGTPARAGEASKPNILLMVSDDLNMHLGCYGCRGLRSPNIDRLATAGRRFDQAYCQYPLCNPSRTSLLSGWRPEHTRVWNNTEAPRSHLAGGTPLQEHFHAQGYFTARVGKVYHVPFEAEFEWDVAEDARGRDSEPASRPSAARRAGGNKAATTGAGDQREEVFPPVPPTPTDRADTDEQDGHTARRVAELIQQHKDGPFFIAAGFHRPHLPWTAPRRYFDLYSASQMTWPAEPGNDRDDIPRIALTGRSFLSISPDQRRSFIAAYQACVSFMDAQVGVLLGTLDHLKLWDLTIVVFCGDNGFHLGEHGIWGKGSLFEESLRVPLIIVAPRMAQPGKATASLAEFVDVYPTLVELCGVPRVEGLEGTSLVPVLVDPETTVKTAAFSMVVRGRAGVATSMRTQRYRYTEWPDDSVELYDHQVDPQEYRNLAREPSQTAVCQELGRTLRAGYKAAVIAR